MYSTTAFVFCIFVAQAHAKELAPSDSFTNKLIDKLFNRGFKASHAHLASLDDTPLKKFACTRAHHSVSHPPFPVHHSPFHIPHALLLTVGSSFPIAHFSLSFPPVPHFPFAVPRILPKLSATADECPRQQVEADVLAAVEAELRAARNTKIEETKETEEPEGQLQHGGSEALGLDDIIIQAGATFIVGLNIKRNRYKTLMGEEGTLWTANDSLNELERLCETAGLEVIGRAMQSLQTPSPSTFIGSGKVDEIASRVKELRVETVVFDDELSPAQQRNLQEKLGVRVVDRTMLILQIFAQRARTREAKLQVELARVQYMLPRLTKFMTSGAGMEVRGGASSGGGGQFLKGIGESQLEVDRRLFRERISHIEKELEKVRSTRVLQRESRKKRGHMPLVALVGYTNAGKSSMLNRLCGKAECKPEVYSDDLLFATLDPTMRRLQLPGGREVLVSDTVGFIQKLPTKLVPAFRATLEVCEDADAILHVVDANSPLGRQQAWSVDEILVDLGVADTPQILVLNKADAVLAKVGMPPEPGQWKHIHQLLTPTFALSTSAITGSNMQELLMAIEKLLVSMSVKVECVLPYSAGNLLAEMHKVGTIVSKEYMYDGYKVVAFVPRPLALRLDKMAIQPEDAISRAG